MRVVVLVEYEVLGDDEYAYVEKYEEVYRNKCEAVRCWRTRFVHDLLARGIVVKSIKELDISYED